MDKKGIIVISLGGSLVISEGKINTKFLSKFNQFIRKKVAEGDRFFIVVGGGQVARHYRDAGRLVIGKVTNEDLDWLGVHATRINAHLLRTIFKDIALPRVIDKYDRKYDISDYPIIVCSGWKPGWSTDYDAVVLAQQYGVETILNLSNIEAVYNKDPKKYKDAYPLERTSWEYFCSLVGERWEPGLSLPFDPMASQLAQKLGLTVIVVKGDNFANLEKLFRGEKFKGTVVGPAQFDASFFDREYFEGEKGESIGSTAGLLKRHLFFLVNLYRAILIKIFLRPKKVLDVGCGFGKMVKYLRWLGVEAYGLEISDYALKTAEDKLKKYLVKGDITGLPYEDNSFDLVTTFDVLEHLPLPKINKALSECLRVSKGLCLHKVFTSENSWIKIFHGVDLSHVSIYPKAWWENFFQESDFMRAKIFFPHLPSFMETIFFLKK